MITAPMTLPNTEPMPPTMSMMTKFVDRSTVKDSGLM